MSSDVTNEEIKATLKSIDDHKASRPDGYTTKFFKATWHLVGDDVYNTVKEFFQTGKILGEFYATMISLVPKNKTPAKVSDYRPIACFNVVY